MSDKNNLGDFVGGFVLGGLIGAAIAGVLAPSSGEETRDELNHLYEKGAHKAQEIKEKLNHSFYELTDLSKDNINRVVDEIREKTEKIARRFNDLTNRGAGVLIEDEIL